MNNQYELIFDAVVEGNIDRVGKLVSESLNGGSTAGDLLNQGLIRAMDEVGTRFERGDMYIPEMLVSAKAMKAGLSILRPYLVKDGIPSIGRVVIGTVKGDMHDIGKNLVTMMLEGAGFEVFDLGTDVAPEKFAAAVRQYSPDIVGLSALLTTTMQQMKNTIEAIDDLGVRNKVKILIGGAPVTQEYSVQISADGYAPDASKAVTWAKTALRMSEKIG